MASRFVHRFLFRPVFGLKVTSNLSQASFVSGVARKNFSTQPNLDVDVEKLAADNGPSPWKLCAAVCLVRLPVLEEEINPLEEKYMNMKDEIEYEHSVYNDWELESQRQQQLIKDIEAGNKNPEDVDFKETNQDLEDSYDVSYNEFKETATLSTPDDEDKKNMNRRPRDSLVLITKQQLGSDMVWMLPRVERSECETMRAVSCCVRNLPSELFYRTVATTLGPSSPQMLLLASTNTSSPKGLAIMTV